MIMIDTSQSTLKTQIRVAYCFDTGVGDTGDTHQFANKLCKNVFW